MKSGSEGGGLAPNPIPAGDAELFTKTLLSPPPPLSLGTAFRGGIRGTGGGHRGKKKKENCPRLLPLSTAASRRLGARTALRRAGGGTQDLRAGLPPRHRPPTAQLPQRGRTMGPEGLGGAGGGGPEAQSLSLTTGGVLQAGRAPRPQTYEAGALEGTSGPGCCPQLLSVSLHPPPATAQPRQAVPVQGVQAGARERPRGGADLPPDRRAPACPAAQTAPFRGMHWNGGGGYPPPPAPGRPAHAQSVSP